jgi:hypothetical protein
VRRTTESAGIFKSTATAGSVRRLAGGGAASSGGGASCSRALGAARAARGAGLYRGASLGSPACTPRTAAAVAHPASGRWALRGQAGRSESGRGRGRVEPTGSAQPGRIGFFLKVFPVRKIIQKKL